MFAIAKNRFKPQLKSLTVQMRYFYRNHFNKSKIKMEMKKLKKNTQNIVYSECMFRLVVCNIYFFEHVLNLYFYKRKH